MQGKYNVFKASEVVQWAKNGIPKKWEPTWNLTGFTGGGSDGSVSPVITPLLIPESITLAIMPIGCMRHGDLHRYIEPEYESRLWYLQVEEKDIVTGQHLRETENAIEEIMKVHKPTPKVIFLVSSCMDILLGSDYETLAKKMEKKLNVRIGVTLMPPLINSKVLVENHVTRKAMYECLRKQSDEIFEKTVNIIGRTRKLSKTSEIVLILKKSGIEKINHITQFDTLDDADMMCQAKLNIAIEPGALPAAEMMKKRWNIPYVYVDNSYNPVEIHENYQKIGKALGVELDDWKELTNAKLKVDEALLYCAGKKIVIGENADRSSFKAALDFMRLGFQVDGVFNKLFAKEDYLHLEEIVKINPDMNVYVSGNPSMYYYVEKPADYDIAIGAGDNFYRNNPNTSGIEVEERYPEYQELVKVLDCMIEFCKGENVEEDDKTGDVDPCEYKVIKRWGVF